MLNRLFPRSFETRDAAARGATPLSQRPAGSAGLPNAETIPLGHRRATYRPGHGAGETPAAGATRGAIGRGKGGIGKGADVPDGVD